MIFWILVAITTVTAVYLGVMFIEEMTESAIGRVVSGIFVFPIAFALVGFFAFGGMALTFLPAKKHPDFSRDTTEVLQALQMGESTNGRIFLGSGVINEQNTFTYYRKNPDGSYQSGRILADYAVIVESNTETPRIVTQHWYWSRWIMPNFVNDGLALGGKSWVIYVPVGSVRPLINTDLPR
ncbi:MAG: hypothetical protein JWP74_1737 [Marmoricola sp.]|nr:hypothetical protein [Marmoricola sp.]